MVRHTLQMDTHRDQPLRALGTGALVLVLLMAVLYTLAIRHNPPPVSLAEIRRTPHEFQHRLVRIEGFVRNYYLAENPQLSSFDLINGGNSVTVRSGSADIPPRNTRVVVQGYYRLPRSYPFVAQHIEMTHIALAPNRWWFDDLDFKTRYSQ